MGLSAAAQNSLTWWLEHFPEEREIFPLTIRLLLVYTTFDD